jgi:3-methyladenine DNA glycosylase/8-oxoguanine DNA glycosylase
MSDPTAEACLDVGFPLDLRSTLSPLRRGTGDPAHRFDDTGRFWRACHTPDGPATVVLDAAGTVVHARGWGSGAGWVLHRLGDLVGANDDWAGLDVSASPVLQDVRRRRPGLRLTGTGLVLDALVPAVLEQKVTGEEARRSWRLLLRRFGEPAPGPDAGLRLPLTARALLGLPTWEWHRAGVDGKRQRAIRAAASVAGRLEECVGLPLDRAAARLRLVPGIGEWTAAETLQRATGAPDAVSVGDYHLPNLVSWVLAGRPRGTDADMLSLLEPWRGQRQRVMRLVELCGERAPRRGPRFHYTDIRAI